MGKIDDGKDSAWGSFIVRMPARDIVFFTNIFMRTNVTVPHSAHRVDPGTLKIPRHEDLKPAPIDGIYDKWFFISGAAV